MTDQGVFPKYSQYIPLIFLIIFTIVSKEKIFIANSVKVVVSLVFLTYVFIPIVSFNLGKNNLVVESLYTILNIIFIIFMLVLRVYSKKYGMEFILKNLIIGNSIGLTYSFLCNLNSFTHDNLKWITSANRTYRAHFGYSHANFAAMFIFSNILMIYVYYYIIKNECRWRGVILIVIFTIIMLFTGSRTAVLCEGIFLLLEIIRNILKRVNLWLKIFLICLIIIILIVTGIFLNIYGFNVSLDLESLYVRINSLKNNISILKGKSLFFGNGAINISSMQDYVSNMKISDNWYITAMLMYGIIGVIIMLFNVFYIVINSIKMKNYFIVNLIITFIIYSTMENVLFVPGALISMLFWGLIFMFL